MTRLIRALVVLGTAALALAGCSSLTESFVQFANDTTLTTEIKTRLATDTGVRSLTDIGVTTDEDRVVLTGTVADEAERQRVETIARRVAGDNRVVSELRVAGAAAASPRVQK
jgi:hyperosmotically inducible periplasmic protein